MRRRLITFVLMMPNKWCSSTQSLHASTRRRSLRRHNGEGRLYLFNIYHYFPPFHIECQAVIFFILLF